jgi:hydrogenase small subunit
VAALGDCAVWGGPHSLRPNPTGATGTEVLLGSDYRSTLGLPVINLPGCAVPLVLNALLAEILGFAFAGGPRPDLDDLHRPRAGYSDVWEGAFVTWQE